MENAVGGENLVRRCMVGSIKVPSIYGWRYLLIECNIYSPLLNILSFIEYTLL